MNDQPSETKKHEPIEVSALGATVGALGLILLVAVAIGLMYGLTRLFEGKARREPAGEAVRPLAPPEALPVPRERPDQQVEMRRQRAESRELLGSYGWVNRSEGIARIPIDRAISLVAEKGMQPWSEHTGQRGSQHPKQGETDAPKPSNP